jgi:colicin import membrane protein
MLGQANATAGAGSASSAGTAAQAGAPSAAYQGRVKAAILPNIVYTGHAPARAVAEVEVNLAPGGTVISRRLVKRSGHPDWDEAVLRAVDRTPRLPVDSDGRVPPMLLISFRPDD